VDDSYQYQQNRAHTAVARALGHVAPVVAGMLFGAPEETPITSEVEAAQAASNAATISGHPAVHDISTTAPAKVAPVAPLTPEDAAAAKTIRMQYRGEETPHVRIGEPAAEAPENVDSAIRDFTAGQKSTVQQIHGSAEEAGLPRNGVKPLPSGMGI